MMTAIAFHLARQDLLRNLLLLPLAAEAAPPKVFSYASDDGAFFFSLPAAEWTLQTDCSPARRRLECSALGRRAVVTAQRVSGGGLVSATVDMGAFGKRLGEFASLQEITAMVTASQPDSARMLDASAITSRSGKAPLYYVLRYRNGDSERVVKLAVQQNRLYMLTVQADARAGLGAEIAAIVASYNVFPVSTMRGGLLSSDAPAVVRSSPLDAAQRT